MATDETTFVTQIRPYDVTGVRDHGVAALMLLAVSLDWNVLQKQHQPVKLIARDGTQKNLPTDTSVKLSVFQTALSTIMVHTEDNMIPTVELMDAIIYETKPDREHARRLRLAVGETPAEHRERLANDKVGERRDDSEHLTFHPEIGFSALGENTSAIREGLMVPHTPPFDGEEHGELVSREPYKAHYSGGGDHTKGYYYESVTSLERIWEDGYKDYECVVCGMAKGSPRAVGSHRQVHVKAGEVERDERYMTAKYRANREKRLAEQKVEFVDELPEEPPANGPSTEEIVDQIIQLVMPSVKRYYEVEIAELTNERDEARKKLAEVEGEFDALLDLLNSRRKT